jgi:hypothetical protein
VRVVSKVNRWRQPVLVAALCLTGTATVLAARLLPEAEAGWAAYVAATERRAAAETAAGVPFLAIDFTRGADADRRVLLTGRVVVHEVEAVSPMGQPIDVPSALVHHWRGDVLLRGASLDDLLSRLQDGTLLTRQEDVQRAAVLERAPGRLKIYLRLQRSKIVTVVYDTEHVVTFARISPTRALSRSVATRIVEVQDPNTADERAMPVGDDHGYLWKLNAYWRYEQVPGGLIVECESISLSRDIPAIFRYLVSPLVESTAKESMVRTLSALRETFAPPVSSTRE